MTFRSKRAAITILIAMSFAAPIQSNFFAQTSTAARPAAPAALSRDQAEALLPATVFFHGQTASIQARNSAGLRLPDGKLLLVAIVDTSGYSSALQQTYQAYLLTEVPLRFGGKLLNPGAYGFGFLAGDQATVMDIGGNEIAHPSTTRDVTLTRPNPLQILPDAAGTFRLFMGRNYVTLAPAEK